MDAVPDAEMHRLFYAVCQAIFYVFCFKYQELSLGTPVRRTLPSSQAYPALLTLADFVVLSQEGNAFFQSLGIDDIIQSRLNPLKVLYSPLEPVISTSSLHH